MICPMSRPIKMRLCTYKTRLRGFGLCAARDSLRGVDSGPAWYECQAGVGPA